LISIYFTIGHIIFVFTTYILHMLSSISHYCKAFYDTIFNLITYFAPNHFKIMASLIYQKGTSIISIFCFYLAEMLFKMHHQASFSTHCLFFAGEYIFILRVYILSIRLIIILILFLYVMGLYLIRVSNL